MELYDISAPLYAGMPKYPSLRDFEHVWERRVDESGVNQSNMRMQMHLGSHVDAPLHYFEGEKSIDEVDLSVFFGKVWVACSQSLVIEAKTVADIPPGYERILFKTPASTALGGKEDCYAYFSVEAAQMLVDRRAILVGIDSFSADQPANREKPVHKSFLRASIAVLEGISLRDVEPGEYRICAAPLKVRGAEGAPCRAFLFRGNSE